MFKINKNQRRREFNKKSHSPINEQYTTRIEKNDAIKTSLADRPLQITQQIKALQLFKPQILSLMQFPLHYKISLPFEKQAFIFCTSFNKRILNHLLPRA